MATKLLGKTKYTENVITDSVDMSADVSNYKRSVCLILFTAGQTVAVGDGVVGLCVPTWMNGLNLVDVTVATVTPGTGSGTTDVQVRRLRAGVAADMLTTKVTLAVSLYTASNETINGSNDDIATGDLIFADVDAINSTPPVGLFVTLTFSN